MRVLLTGASGFIGGEVLRRLLAAGHEVRAVVRRPGALTPRPELEVVAGDFATDHDPAVWRARLDDVDAVVNTVGLIRERGRSTFSAVQTAAPRALFEASAGCGVRRIVQISAFGARPDHPRPFLSSKGLVDNYLLSLPVEAVVLRPSLVVGAAGESARLFRSLAALPIVPVPGDGGFRFNPIDVADVARAVCEALTAAEMPVGVYDLGGADQLTLEQMLLRLRGWLGERATGPVVHLPLALMRLPAWFGDATGLGPIDSAQLELLQDGAAVDLSPFQASFGFTPRGLDALLLDAPPTEAQRWHARLVQLKVPIRLLIATIWLVTPTVSLLQWDLSLELQLRSGVPASLAPALLLASCALEYLIAIPLVVGRCVRIAGWIQLALMVFFTVFLTATRAELWLDPFGPLSKNLPLIAGTLAMIALEDRRESSV